MNPSEVAPAVNPLPAAPAALFSQTNLDQYMEGANLANGLEQTIKKAEAQGDPSTLFKVDFLSSLHSLQRSHAALACELQAKVIAVFKKLNVAVDTKEYRRAVVQSRPVDLKDQKQQRLLPKDYYKIAREFLATSFPEVDGVCPLVYFEEDFYLFTGRRYQRATEGGVRAMLWPWLSDSWTMDAKGAVVPFSPTSTSVSSALDALKGITLLEYDDTSDACASVWRVPRLGDPDPKDLCVLMNGIYDTMTYQLLPHTARLFMRIELPFAFDPSARCDRWLQFSQEVFEGDQERVLALQQFMGYLLTTDNRIHKGLLCYGASRSGKSTIQAIIAALVGPENTCSPSLSLMGETFGLEDFIGKRVALISDAHLGSNSDARMVVEAIKMVSGGDARSVPRKHKTSLRTRMTTRMVIAANELPSLPDASNALMARLIFLPFNTSFLGREDFFLESTLKAELAGIFNWALNGLYQLRQTWRIQQPSAGMSDMREFAQLSNPVGSFLESCCDLGENYEVETTALYTLWKLWAEQNEVHPGSPPKFGIKLRSANPMIRKIRPRSSTGERSHVYSGVRIKNGLKLPGDHSPRPATFGGSN